jgi:hypothetical protein
VCGAENMTLRKADQKCLERVEMWYWRAVQSVVLIMLKTKKYYKESKKKGKYYVQQNEGKLTGLVTCCVGTGF